MSTSDKLREALLRDLLEYAASNPGAWIFPLWDGDRITRALAQPMQEAVAKVPLQFVREFNTLAHNYSLSAEPHEYYRGVAADAFRDAYKRCGQDLAKLRTMLTASPAAPVVVNPIREFGDVRYREAVALLMNNDASTAAKPEQPSVETQAQEDCGHRPPCEECRKYGYLPSDGPDLTAAYMTGVESGKDYMREAIAKKDAALRACVEALRGIPLAFGNLAYTEEVCSAITQAKEAQG